MRIYIIRFLVVFLLLANTATLFAQFQAAHEIDSVMDLSPYYLPTCYTKIGSIEFEQLTFKTIDTGMTATHQFDPLYKTENICQSLGIVGQAHQSTVFDYQREMGFLFQHFPYPLSFRKQSDVIFYKLQTTYSKIAYTISFPKENRLFAEFAKYMKGVTVAANIYGVLDEGNTQNFCGNLLLHYETPSSIYGFKASAIINNLNNAEKGGLKDVEAYQGQPQYAVLTPYANSKITDIDFSLQNYVNIINKNNKYFGTFAHDFQLCRTTLLYKNKFDTIFHPYYETYDSATLTNDSARIFTLRNVVQWSNFMPYKEISSKSNFFHIAGGIMHDYTELKFTHVISNSLYLFARTHIRLFQFMDIRAKISYSFYGYTHNDLVANAEASWSINDEKKHVIGLSANFYRNSPEYFMQHVTGNHFRWDTSFSKQSIVQLKAFWDYKKYKLSVSYYNIYKLVYLTEELRPMQDYNIGNMVQFSTFIPYRYKNFGVTANLNLQYCTKNVVNVPLFTGKLSVFYIFEFLKKRLKIQVGTDLMYNTAYYADGYLPVLHTFHRQNSQLIGNFPFWDANVTFQIDRINFFFRIGNLLQPFIFHTNFTTPNYPDVYKISLGITWKFFD